MINKYYFLISILLFSNLNSKLNIYSLFESALDINNLPYNHIEEYNSYKLLKNQQNKIAPNLNYFAIPWNYYLKNQAFVAKLKKELYSKSRSNRNTGFTVALCWKVFIFTDLLKELGIKYVFTPQVHKSRQYINGITYLPLPHGARNWSPPVSNKDILYSFMGSPNRPVRVKILNELSKRPNTAIKSTTRFHYHKSKQEQKEDEKIYREVLSRSRFSLCPRGSHPGSFRFWESLASGAIPIVLADDILLPSNYDWKACAIFVPEKDVLKVDSIIRKISPKEEAKLRLNGLKAYKLFSGDNYISPILSNINYLR